MIDTVLDKVLAIVVVIELVGHFLTVVSLYGDLELITTGLAVLAFIVTGLNDEFNRLTNGLIFQKTWSETKRLKSTSVQEVCVVDKRGGKFVSEDGKLHCAVFGTELFEIGGVAGHFGLRDESTG